MAKLKAKCPSCNFNLTLGPVNSTLVRVTQHEYMSYLRVECSRPQCGHSWFMFLDAEDPAEARRMLRITQRDNWPVQIQTPTPQHVIEDYEEAAEIHLVKPLEDSDIEPSVRQRHDRAVATLAWELETATVEDILNTDIENRLPKAWL